MRLLSSILTMNRSVFSSPSCLLSVFGMTTTLELSAMYALAVVTIFSIVITTSNMYKIDKCKPIPWGISVAAYGRN